MSVDKEPSDQRWLHGERHQLLHTLLPAGWQDNHREGGKAPTHEFTSVLCVMLANVPLTKVSGMPSSNAVRRELDISWRN